MATYTYEIETYSLFGNGDISLLDLNPCLETYGYKFVLVSITELEKNFKELFMPNVEYESKEIIRYDANNEISSEFHHALSISHPLGFSMKFDKGCILLKALKNTTETVNNNALDSDASWNAAAEMQKFSDALLLQLRLFKAGQVYKPTEFQIQKDNRRISSRLLGATHLYSHEKYYLSRTEAHDFTKFFNPTFKPNALTELAINSFMLSYSILDLRTRFTVLMICLESLFNRGKDQIAHTVSRHLSILLSKNIDEFKENYKDTKTLYGLRSAIVHGSESKIDTLHKSLEDLQQKVRDAIRKCLELDMNKDQLFEYLNAKGFNS